MGRPALPIGTWGDISVKRITSEGVIPEKWRAITRVRDIDGVTRQVERYGPTKDKAKRNLLEALKKRVGKNPATLTATSRFRDAAAIYLERIRTTRRGTTYDRYRGNLNNHALPALGALYLTECTAGRIEAYLDSLAELDHDTDEPRYSPNTRRGIRKVISGTLQVAVRQGILDANPAKSLSPIEGGPKRKARAMDETELRTFLTKLDSDKPSRRADLPDLIRFLFGTGTRYGEALAVRWLDLNLTDEPMWITEPNSGQREKLPARSVWINGNLVHVTGKGVVRHDGKTFAAKRIIGLPAFLHALLFVRRPAEASNREPVFPSTTLGWRHPSNVQRSIRRMRERLGSNDFHTHDGRATVITLLDEAKQTTRQVADVVGHSQLTTTHAYMGRGMANPHAAAIIDAAHRPTGAS